MPGAFSRGSKYNAYAISKVSAISETSQTLESWWRVITRPEFPHTKRVARRDNTQFGLVFTAFYASRCLTDSLPLASMQHVSKTSWAVVTPSGLRERCSTCVNPNHYASLPANHCDFSLYSFPTMSRTWSWRPRTEGK